MRFQEIQEACWSGYRQAGMKKKGDRQVPNCVPVTEVEVGPEITANQLLYKAAAMAMRDAGREGITLDYDQAIKQASKIYGIPYTPSELPKLLAQRQEIDRQLALLKQGKQVAKQRRQEKLAPTPAGAEEYWKTHALPTDRIKPPAKTLEAIEEDLKKWFKEKWVRFGPDGKIRGDCARGSSKEGKPKCLPQSKAHALGKSGRASAAAKKRREDPNPERRGAAKNVATKVREQGVVEGHTTIEAFGRSNTSPLDKELAKEIPKNAAEITGITLGVIGGVGSAVAGLLKGISFVSPQADWATAGYVLAGGFGAILGSVIGIMPGAIIVGSSNSFQKREKIKSERLSQFIKNNPSMPSDLEKFVNNLITQTPNSILKMSNYITHLMIDSPETSGRVGVGTKYNSMTGDETEQRTKELVKLVEAYFMQQEKQWESIASKYNVHPDTLYQIYNSINQEDIESRWLEGIKQQITAPKQGMAEGIPFDQCPACGGPIVHISLLSEKQDACYHKVKSRYKVWPSAYASGALVQCRKKGAANWGTGAKKK